MNLLVILLLGGLAGWLASMVTARDSEMGILWNIVVGVVGAFLANWLLAPVLGVAATLSEFSLSGFLMSVLGAIVLLIIVNLFTRKSVR